MKLIRNVLSVLLLLGLLTVAFEIQPIEALSYLPSATADVKEESHSITSLPPIYWIHYHNYTEITTILFALNETYPQIVDVFSIGKSTWNRDIYCIRLTNESDHVSKPQVFFVGYHHAREAITAELALYFVVYATTNYGLNATITELLNKSEIYVVVALNVDGFDLFKANDFQRKNARPTNEDGDGPVDEDPPEDEDGDGFIEQLGDYTDPANPVFIRWEGTDNDGDGRYAEDWIGGVDLNRNYNYSWENGVTNPRSEIYRGPAPFSEPETQAIRNLVLGHDFMYAVSFHSGSELILYPWGCTTTPPPNQAKFIEISADLSNITGGTTYMQSCYLYYSYGLWDDWMYGVAHVPSLTCEIFANYTWEGVWHPGPYPNTFWSGGLRYAFNPFPTGIESVIMRWFPIFLYMTNRTISDAYHDMAVNDIAIDKSSIGEGFTSEVNITVQNKGTFAETFNLTLYANTTAVQTKTFVLENHNPTVLKLYWNTSGFAKGNYTLRALAWPISGELNTTNNDLTEGWAVVTIPGDVDHDFDVDIYDVVAVCCVYNAKKGEPAYNGNGDINCDGEIDIFDIVIACSNYGEKYP
jgi:hypothetical protein